MAKKKVIEFTPEELKIKEKEYTVTEQMKEKYILETEEEVANYQEVLDKNFEAYVMRLRAKKERLEEEERKKIELLFEFEKAYKEVFGTEFDANAVQKLKGMMADYKRRQNGYMGQ